MISKLLSSKEQLDPFRFHFSKKKSHPKATTTNITFFRKLITQISREFKYKQNPNFPISILDKTRRHTWPVASGAAKTKKLHIYLIKASSNKLSTTIQELLGRSTQRRKN